MGGMSELVNTEGWGGISELVNQLEINQKIADFYILRKMSKKIGKIIWVENKELIMRS